jgi:hypothetical protein
VIETEKEVASDMLLVQLVKLRLISERVTEWSVAQDNVLRPPAMFYVKSLQVQLNDFKSNIPTEFANNSKSLICSFCTALPLVSWCVCDQSNNTRE